MSIMYNWSILLIQPIYCLFYCLQEHSFLRRYDGLNVDVAAWFYSAFEGQFPDPVCRSLSTTHSPFMFM